MKSVIEMRRSAPLSSCVSLEKPFTPVVDCKGHSEDCVASKGSRCDTYQDFTEMRELQGEVSGTREEQEHADDKYRSVDMAPIAPIS